MKKKKKNRPGRKRILDPSTFTKPSLEKAAPPTPDLVPKKAGPPPLPSKVRRVGIYLAVASVGTNGGVSFQSGAPKLVCENVALEDVDRVLEESVTALSETLSRTPGACLVALDVIGAARLVTTTVVSRSLPEGN